MTLSIFLKQPFTYLESSRERWTYIKSASFFLMFFIIVYQPFGLSEDIFDDPETTFWEKVFFVLFEGLSAFLALVFSQFYLRKKIWPKTTITNRKYLRLFVLESFFVSIIFSCLSTIYILFNWEVYEEEELSTAFLILEFVIEVIEIGFAHVLVLSYPFIVTIFIGHVRRLNSEVSELERLIEKVQKGYKTRKDEDNRIKLLDENGNAELDIDMQDLLFLESDNQYVFVHYLEDNSWNKKIVRTRLKKMLSELSDSPILQSHRSYAVNLLHVEGLKTEGKKTYLVLNVDDFVKVPVSKTHLEQIRKDLVNF